MTSGIREYAATDEEALDALYARAFSPATSELFRQRWRWEFEAVSPTLTRVTETFDYRDTGPIKDTLKYYKRFGFVRGNVKGIEATLTKLAVKYPA